MTLGQPSSHTPHPPPHFYHCSSESPSKSAIADMPQPHSKLLSATPLIAGTQTASVKVQVMKPVAIALRDHPTQQNTSSLSAPFSPIIADFSLATTHTSGSFPLNRAAMPLPNSSTTPNSSSGPCLLVPTPRDLVCIPVLGTDLYFVSLFRHGLSNFHL